MYTKEQLLDILYPVKDPDIRESIIDMGLIYDIYQKEEDVYVTMTLTSPACPVGPEIINNVEQVLRHDENIREAYIELTFDPMWSPERMTEDLRLEYGIEI